MLEKAIRKFQQKRWAELHVLVFDNASALMTVERVTEVVAGFEPGDFGSIDLVLVADKDIVRQVWPDERRRTLATAPRRNHSIIDLTSP